jgi:hypothetical protein
MPAAAVISSTAFAAATVSYVTTFASSTQVVIFSFAVRLFQQMIVCLSDFYILSHQKEIAQLLFYPKSKPNLYFHGSLQYKKFN